MNKGSPSAQYGLAYMHLTGLGAEPDHDEAFKLFTKVGCKHSGKGAYW